MLKGASATSSVIGMVTARTVQLRSTPIARAATLSASRLKPHPAAPTSSDWATAWGWRR